MKILTMAQKNDYLRYDLKSHVSKSVKYQNLISFCKKSLNDFF